MPRIWYISAALLGMVMHSTGLVLQKKGMDHLNFKRLRDFKITRDLIIWVIGLLLAYVISVFPTGVASKGLSPQIVSSVSGLTIVLVIILSYFFLGERIFKSDILYSAVIILCIFGISVLEDSTPSLQMDRVALYILILAPFLLLTPILRKKTDEDTKALLFSAFSGLTSGLSFVLLNIAVKEAGSSFSGMFSSLYTYEYSVVGFFSGLAMQAAYRYGRIVNIVPVQISLSVIFPLICSYFIFHKSISPMQDLMILVIAACCWAILKKH